jgi:hypothetical protein
MATAGNIMKRHRARQEDVKTTVSPNTLVRKIKLALQINTTCSAGHNMMCVCAACGVTMRREML